MLAVPFLFHERSYDMGKLNIIYKPLENIIEYENNPRKNEEAIEPVMESIKNFGFLIPILLDKNNIIVAGHTRKKAAEKLNINEIPCIYVEELTEEQIKAFRLADNKTAEFSEWDIEKLEKELSEIMNIDMENLFHFPDFTADTIDVTDEDFFQENKLQHDKKIKTAVCPHCGKEFEL